MEEYVVSDLEIAEKFRACKNASFPLCLERSLVGIFTDKEKMISLAEKAGFDERAVSSTRDIWKLYFDLLSSLDKIIGRDSTAVIESRIIEEIESMHCTECPIYKMEVERMERQFKEPLPTVSKFLLCFKNEL